MGVRRFVSIRTDFVMGVRRVSAPRAHVLTGVRLIFKTPIIYVKMGARRFISTKKICFHGTRCFVSTANICCDGSNTFLNTENYYVLIRVRQNICFD